MANAWADIFGPGGKAIADSSGHGKNKVNTIQDPLAQQKTAAANLGLQNYQTASSNIPGLKQYYTSNFGQSPTDTLGKLDPLFQDVYGSVQGDVTGKGGPFTSLKKNLLGDFDTQATKSTSAENQQLENLGLLGSGPGMSAQNDLASQLATQRGITSGNVDTQLLNMAQGLSQALMGYNQQYGFSDPMAALGEIQSLANPPQFQNLDQTYYQQPSTMSQIAPILGTIGANAIPAMMTGGASLPMTLPSSMSSMPGFSPMNYSMNTSPYYPGMQMPGLQYSSL